MTPISLLVIDDDPNIRKLLSELLGSRPEYRLLVAGDGKEAVRFFVEGRVDVVLTDIHMPNVTGIELMADMQKVRFRPEILVMTANATPENVEKAKRIGARSIILKPFDDLSIIEEEIAGAADAVRQARAAKGPPHARPAAPAVAAAPVARVEPVLPARPAPRVEAVAPAQQAKRPEPVARARPATPAGPATPTGPPTPRAAVAPAAVPPVSKKPPGAPPEDPQAMFADLAEPDAPEDVSGSHPPAAPTAEQVPALPGELEDIFRLEASLDVGRMKMHVPVICLQTQEEKAAVRALYHAAAAAQREFYTWSAARGLLRDNEQPMGEMYQDPIRALEFVRRQKGRGLYIMADFRGCLEDRTVVRLLREMVMEQETAHGMLVLTAPRLALPPELMSACVVFDWPASGSTDLAALFEEVRAEVQSATRSPVQLDGPTRDALLARVKGMPAGRARFEMARALMATVKKAS